MSRLPDIAAGTVSEHGMLTGGPVVALVSGGADSTALLLLLSSEAFGDLRLSVLHVDHMLRGAASSSDALFVEGLCAGLGVPCRVVTYDVSGYAAAERLNLEDAGRRVRYRFAEEELDARCVAAGADSAAGRVAVAHTFDDRMETFLMRLAQGSGPAGLTSIPYVRGRVVRPLLDARRADVLSYLRGFGQSWREDATNADATRLRSRVRAEILPLFESVNPRFDEALARTLTVLADEDELLDDLARAAAGDLIRQEGRRLLFDRARLAALDRPMQRRVLRLALFGAFPEASRLEQPHVEALLDGMADERFARDLPDGLRAVGEYDTLIVSRGESEPGSLAPSLLDVPGVVDLGEGGTLLAEAADPKGIDEDPMTALIDADKVSLPFTVDSAGQGDRMRPLGMRGRRRLSEVLADARVPRRSRPLVPVVRSAGQVVWIAGVRMSEDYRVRPETSRAVRLRWTGTARQEETA